MPAGLVEHHDRVLVSRQGAGERVQEGPVAKFGNGGERGWTGSDLPRRTQPEDRANPPVSQPAHKLCDRPDESGRSRSEPWRGRPCHIRVNPQAMSSQKASFNPNVTHFSVT